MALDTKTTVTMGSRGSRPGNANLFKLRGHKPIMRLEVVGQKEGMLLLIFILSWWLLVMVLSVSSPKWTLEDTFIAPVPYCDLRNITTNDSGLLPGTCSNACFLDNSSSFLDYASSLIEENQAEYYCRDSTDSGYISISNVTRTPAESCPFDGEYVSSVRPDVTGPSVEGSHFAISSLYSSFGFDIYMTINRKMVNNGTGTSNSDTVSGSTALSSGDNETEVWDGQPYTLNFTYLANMLGTRVRSGQEQSLQLFDLESSVNTFCPGVGEECRIKLLNVSTMLDDICMAVMNFDPLIFQIGYRDGFSPTQPSLLVHDIGTGESSYWSSNSYGGDVINDVQLIMHGPSVHFFSVMAWLHFAFWLMAVGMSIFFYVTSYRKLGMGYSRWYVERKWCFIICCCGIFVAFDMLYIPYATGMVDFSKGNARRQLPLLFAVDAFVINTALGVVLCVMVCFIANFRNLLYVEVLPWRFYIDKLIFLGFWETLVAAKFVIEFILYSREYNPEWARTCEVIGRWLSLLLVLYYYILTIIHSYFTDRALRGSWNSGVRHRQVGYRFLTIIQLLGLVLFICEMVIDLGNTDNKVTDYGISTGFNTLHLNNFGTNIYILGVVLVVSWCYLPAQIAPTVWRKWLRAFRNRSNPVRNRIRPRKTRLLEETPVDKYDFSLQTMHNMIEFCALAYKCPPGTVDGTKTPLDVDKAGIELIEFISIAEVDTHCIIFSKGDDLVVSFRGTASSANANTDLKAQLSDVCWTSMEANTHHTCEFSSECRRSRIRVHAGFMKSFTAIRRRVLSRIQCLVDESDPDIPSNALSGGLSTGDFDRMHSCPLYGNADSTAVRPSITRQIISHVYVCGHSLGGALATLFAYQCAQLLPDVGLSVYTFGSPRVGNGHFANAYDHIVPDTHRIVNDGDPVTSVPKFIWLKVIDLGYKHVGVVYIISATGDIVVDPSFMERFVKVKPKYNIAAHLTGSYRKSIAAVIVNSVRSSNMIDASCGLCAALQTITSVLQAPGEMGQAPEPQDASAEWLSSSPANLTLKRPSQEQNAHAHSQHFPFDTRSLAEEAIERVTSAPRAFSENTRHPHGKSDTKKSSIDSHVGESNNTKKEGSSSGWRSSEMVGPSNDGQKGMASIEMWSHTRIYNSSSTPLVDVNSQSDRLTGRRRYSSGLHRGFGVQVKTKNSTSNKNIIDNTISDANINKQPDDHG